MAKIDKKLLQKYFNGNCSEAEKAIVEVWLASDEYDEPLTLDEPTKKVLKSSMWENISADMGFSKTTRVIPLYSKLIRYAAAACVIFAIFFAGRLSVNKTHANPVVDKAPKDQLYIYGGSGAKGSLPGQAFKLKFDGRIKLFNGSLGLKKIQVGDEQFVLKSYQSYYLSGTVEKPTLFDSKRFPYDHFEEIALKGDFSIIRLDN